jgi:hypothetical protein
VFSDRPVYTTTKIDGILSSFRPPPPFFYYNANVLFGWFVFIITPFMTELRVLMLSFPYYVPKSLTQPLAKVKNGDEQFWK